MSKTKSELITETLQELGALGAGQTASAEDTAAVDARVQPLLDDLAARNVVYIGGSDAIDESVFSHLVQILAQLCAPKFGAPMDPNAIAYAEKNLRTISRINRGTGRNLRVDCALRPFNRLR